jgi:hypothetical protein
METPPSAPETFAPTPKREPPLVLRLALIAGGILLVGMVLILGTTDYHAKKVVWLTQGDLRAGRIENLKNMLMRMTSPLWRSYWSRQPLVLISSTMLATPATFPTQYGLGVPSGTNADGLQVWLLSETELKALRQQVKTLPGYMRQSSPRMQTAAGVWASVSMLNAGAGLTVTLKANAAGNAWTLTAGAIQTEPTASASTNVVLLHTNFAAACRATIPNAGAMVIQSANQTGATGTNFWLIISPVAMDAQGKPVPR